jgi:hypothetical protein
MISKKVEKFNEVSKEQDCYQKWVVKRCRNEYEVEAGVAIAILAQCVSEMRSKERPKCNYDRFM